MLCQIKAPPVLLVSRSPYAKSTQSSACSLDMENRGSMSQRIDRNDGKRLSANLGLLTYAAVFCLSIAGDGLAFECRAPAAGRPAVAKPFRPNFGCNAGPAAPGVAGAALLTHEPGGQGEPAMAQTRGNEERANLGRPNQAERDEAGLGRNHRGRQPAYSGLRNVGLVGGGFRNDGPSGFARNGLPLRPFPGKASSNGIPPRGETRFVSNEIVFHAPSNVSAQVVDAAARRLGLVAISSQKLTLSGGTLFRFRIDNGRQVSDVVRELEAENIGFAQPNYIYRLQ